MPLHPALLDVAPADRTPTMIASLVAFALVAGLVTITPGADTMLVLSSAARGGVGRGLATAAGTVSGVYCWGLAAAAGASAVLTASETAYAALKLAGAAYLLWLGATALRSSFRRAPGGDGPTHPDTEPTRSLSRAYLRGLLTNLLNPKVGVFYLSFLPQFLPRDVAVLPAGVLLTSVHVLEAAVPRHRLVPGSPGRRLAPHTQGVPGVGPHLRHRVHRLRPTPGRDPLVRRGVLRFTIPCGIGSTRQLAVWAAM